MAQELKKTIGDMFQQVMNEAFPDGMTFQQVQELSDAINEMAHAGEMARKDFERKKASKV